MWRKEEKNTQCYKFQIRTIVAKFYATEGNLEHRMKRNEMISIVYTENGNTNTNTQIMQVFFHFFLSHQFGNQIKSTTRCDHNEIPKQQKCHKWFFDLFETLIHISMWCFLARLSRFGYSPFCSFEIAERCNNISYLCEGRFRRLILFHRLAFFYHSISFHQCAVRIITKLKTHWTDSFSWKLNIQTWSNNFVRLRAHYSFFFTNSLIGIVYLAKSIPFPCIICRGSDEFHLDYSVCIIFVCALACHSNRNWLLSRRKSSKLFYYHSI